MIDSRVKTASYCGMGRCCACCALSGSPSALMSKDHLLLLLYHGRIRPNSRTASFLRQPRNGPRRRAATPAQQAFARAPAPAPGFPSHPSGRFCHSDEFRRRGMPTPSPDRQPQRLRAANRREQDPKTTNTCEDSIKKLQRQEMPVTLESVSSPAPLASTGTRKMPAKPNK